MLTLIFIAAVVIFAAAFKYYGSFLEKRYEVNDSCPTPSHTDYDGVDRVPAKRPVLLGHHFSSIAGAGPIVGPIIASVAFGWLPAMLWVIIGSVFIGGVHDFSSLMASIRHKARSIAEVAKEYMSPLSYKLFLIYIWLTLVYLLIVFTDLTSNTFVQDQGVASSSIMFMALAVGFGISVYRMKLSVLKSSLIFVPLVFLCAYGGQLMPINLKSIPFLASFDAIKTWGIILVIYCFIASTTPVWILLQPRDYLSSYLLYASVAGAFAGILMGGFTFQYPAFTNWYSPQIGGALFPILFITIACGACSGFHSIVASGTSSKQLDKESDARTIGYGAMLIEGLVAVIAIITVAMVAKTPELEKASPLFIYGGGMGKFLAVFGIPEKLGFSFGLLALSTFILTTLDTATRLARYIFEELFDLKGAGSRYLSTALTLVMPAVFTIITLYDRAGNPIPAWKVIWPIFGATNQLMAGLALLVIFVWLKKTGRKTGFIIIPMLFMITMTIIVLVQFAGQYGLSVIGVIAMLLLCLSGILIFETGRILLRDIPKAAGFISALKHTNLKQ